ncbi:MAG: hypothetical protein OSJ31_02735 [Alistipes sp.]|jgi:hypothetical protein|nr:hypothetical protein [Alistipes sp.]
MSERFHIEVASRYEELWRYNIELTGQTADSGGSRLEYISASSFVAPVGSKLEAAPEGYSPAGRDIGIDTEPAESLTLYIYVIPNTLPTERTVDLVKPFTLDVRISRGEEMLYDRHLSINQFSGDNIEIKL